MGGVKYETFCEQICCGNTNVESTRNTSKNMGVLRVLRVLVEVLQMLGICTVLHSYHLPQQGAGYYMVSARIYSGQA